MKITHVIFLITAAFCLHAGNVLLINSEFTNRSGSSLPLPGWNIERGQVSRIRIDKDDYGAELGANAKVVSEHCPVKADTVKLEAEVSGSGMGRLSYTAFDKDGKPIKFRQDGIRFSAHSRKSKIKAKLSIPGEAHFIAVTLETGANSKIIFEDVEAEFEAPFRKILPQDETIALENDRYYRFSDLPELPFSVTLKRGQDIEFKVENTRGGHWSSKNTAACIPFFFIKSMPYEDGIWPFRRYKQKFEIKAEYRGKTDIVFTHSTGKSFVVKLTVE